MTVKLESVNQIQERVTANDDYLNWKQFKEISESFSIPYCDKMRKRYVSEGLFPEAYDCGFTIDHVLVWVALQILRMNAKHASIKVGGAKKAMHDFKLINSKRAESFIENFINYSGIFSLDSSDQRRIAEIKKRYQIQNTRTATSLFLIDRDEQRSQLAEASKQMKYLNQKQYYDLCAAFERINDILRSIN